jgi:hypothetical protein
LKNGAAASFGLCGKCSEGFADDLWIVKKCGGADRRFQGSLALQTRLQELEALDRAASAHARMDGVPFSAELQIVSWLKVKIPIEIQSRTAFVELGPNPRTICQHEIDLVVTEQERAANCRNGDAFRPPVFDPLDLRHNGMRLNRHAENDLVLDDEPRNRLANGSRLRGKNAEQERQQA